MKKIPQLLKCIKCNSVVLEELLECSCPALTNSSLLDVMETFTDEEPEEQTVGNHFRNNWERNSTYRKSESFRLSCRDRTYNHNLPNRFVGEIDHR